MYRKEKKLPTIIALFLLCFGFGGIFYFDKVSTQTITSAKYTSTPQNIHFSNISDTTITASWFSEKKELGNTQIKMNGKTFTYLDENDSDNVSRPRTTHYITFKNLAQNSPYQIKIIGGDPRCTTKDACPMYEKTTSKKTSLSNFPPVRGTIVTSDNKPAEETIVYLVIGKSSPLSGRVDNSGLWVIPIQNLLTSDDLTKFEPQDTDTVEITAFSDSKLFAKLSTTFKSLRENSIIPRMQLGITYNLTGSSLEQTGTANTLGIQDEKYQTDDKGSLQLFFPKKQSDTTIDNRPRFRGVGQPGKQILITVNSTPQTAKITIGNDGVWDWRPPKILPPGKHFISIEGYDEYGNNISIKRDFFVLKSGESVLGDATNSATLTPTQQPSPTPATPSETPIPTITIVPSNTPIPTQVLSPTSAESFTPTTPPPTNPPKTGNGIYFGLFATIGIGLMIAGFALLP